MNKILKKTNFNKLNDFSNIKRTNNFFLFLLPNKSHMKVIKVNRKNMII